MTSQLNTLCHFVRHYKPNQNVPDIFRKHKVELLIAKNFISTTNFTMQPIFLWASFQPYSTTGMYVWMCESKKCKWKCRKVDNIKSRNNCLLCLFKKFWEALCISFLFFLPFFGSLESCAQLCIAASSLSMPNKR